jgi:hypothetical protein
VYTYSWIYIYIYLFIKSILHVSAHTATSSGRTSVTSAATNSFYQYCWYRHIRKQKFKTRSWKTTISKTMIFSGNNEAKREVCGECGCTWHACQVWDVIHGLIFSEKHYTNRDRNHNPYVVTAFCLCTRSGSIVNPLYLLTWRIWWAPNNASKWQMGFNSAFKGLSQEGQAVRKWRVCMQWPISFTDFVMRTRGQRL